MDTNYRDVVVDRALRELSSGAFADARGRKRLEQVLQDARRSDDVSAAGLKESVQYLADEYKILDILERQREADEPVLPGAEALSVLLGLMSLLYLLALLLRYFSTDRDVITWMDELRQAIQDLLEAAENL